MKSYNRVLLGIIIMLLCIITGVNLFLTTTLTKEYGRQYQVEINRIVHQIHEKGSKNINLEQYNYIVNIAVWDKKNKDQLFFEGNGMDYTIRIIDGVYYRFDYQIQLNKEYEVIVWIVNIGMLIMTLTILFILVYIRSKLIKPFHSMKEVPYELSKGNLTIGLKENKNRFFGRFIWGLDLLREHLEEQKQKELNLQREKKTLVLSISHDIKTPLSVIKLYSQALRKNLYTDEQKRMEIVDHISRSADVIEGFVSDIIKASSEEFLNLNVNPGEIYMGELVEKIEQFYSEKLAYLKINFTVRKYHNCLIKGDLHRAVEILQNIIENAIKYGDGNNISIDFYGEEDCQLVTITNTGCSLSEKELPFVFDSFWRGSNVGNQSGNGLGLYICRQLIRKMDGDIYVQRYGDEMKVTVVFRMI